MAESGTSLEELRHDKVIGLAEERFKKIAPARISFEAEKGYAIQLLENNDYLMRAAMENKGSLLQAITNVAAIGLSLNPAKKQAYLIPRNMKVGNQWVTKVFLEPSFVGLCDLATQSGTIEWVQARCVYANDTFEDNGVGEKPTHKYNAFSKNRGDFVGVYCVAKTVQGDYLIEIMDAEAVISIRDRSEAYKSHIEKGKGNGGPWVSDFEEMARKSVVRRAFKMWPKSKEMERLEEAVHISNENEGFEPIRTSPETGQFTAQQKEYFDHMITQNDAIGMFCFVQSIEESVYFSLYNSFEKGSIGKYKALVGELERNGASLIQDCVAAINDSAGQDDTHGVAEVIDGLPDDAINYLLDHCSQEGAAMIRSLKDE